MADKLWDADGLPTFGNLNVSIFGCPSIVMPIFSHATCSSNIAYSLVFHSPKIAQLRTQRHTCYDERAESSRHVPTRMSIPSATDSLIGDDEQQITICSSEFEHQKSDGGSTFATQGQTPAREASAEFHGEPIVPDVPQGDHALTGGSEDGKLFSTCIIHSYFFPFPSLFWELSACVNICYRRLQTCTGR